MADDEPTPLDMDDWRAKSAARLAKLRDTNQQKYRAILAHKLIPNPSAILQARLEALLEMVLDADGRLAFDVLFEEKMTGVLNECLADARDKQLVIPTGGTKSGLIVPG